MPTSTDITLPADKTPKFPASCVVCDCETDDAVTIAAHQTSWWTAITWWFGKRINVTVPACKRCGFKLHIHRWGSFILMGLMVLLILPIIVPIIKPNIAPPLQNYVVMIALLVCLIPYFVFDAIFPPAIDVTFFDDEITYQFRDAHYAFRFGLYNDVKEANDALMESVADIDSDPDET